MGSCISKSNTEAPRKRPDLLNPLPGRNATFTEFPKLPTEIRCMIWEQALSYERLIPVDILSLASNFNRNGHRLRHPHPNCVTLIPQRFRLDPVFHATRESRSIVFEVHRVHLPCCYGYSNLFKDKFRQKAMIYINPELDTIEIKDTFGFVDFAHRFWFYDPRKVGLRNVAFRDFNDDEDFFAPHNEAGEARLQQVLSRIRNVMFILTVTPGTLAHRYIHRDSRGGGYTRLKDFRALPLLKYTSLGFSRQQDHRFTTDTMRQLWSGLLSPDLITLKETFSRWKRLLASLEVKTSCDYTFSYGTIAWKDDVRHTDMTRILREVEKNALRWEELCAGLKYVGEDTQQPGHATQPVVGFWVFPEEALGRLPQEDWRAIDLSVYRPQLCLSYL
ncbi:hypothetical protein FHETE_5881 [Fusarium heterosporum]|uniref:2EXR domain-containing protein n=1 Tax=Fusarium heterosporum TaxID=42747 RepID=A0A8H5TC91_FUSHE|nr:hypothetical protein FHETE_5881 [Fusarium heterosporum]